MELYERLQCKNSPRPRSADRHRYFRKRRRDNHKQVNSKKMKAIPALYKSRGLRPSRTRTRKRSANSAMAARLGRGGHLPLPPQAPPSHPPRSSCGTLAEVGPRRAGATGPFWSGPSGRCVPGPPYCRTVVHQGKLGLKYMGFAPSDVIPPSNLSVLVRVHP
jgi:hypothetical protein